MASRPASLDVCPVGRVDYAHLAVARKECPYRRRAYRHTAVDTIAPIRFTPPQVVAPHYCTVSSDSEFLS